MLDLPVGENVLIRPNERVSYMGRVENIESLDRTVMITMWRLGLGSTPDEVRGEDRWFYGRKELLLTDHYQHFKARSIERKLKVHSLSDCHTQYSVTGNNQWKMIYEFIAIAGR